MRRAILPIIFLILAVPAFGQSPDAPAADPAPAAPSPAEEAQPRDWRPTDLVVRFTVQVVVNRDQSDPIVSGPSPVVTVPGLAVAFPFAAGFSFMPGLEYYTAYYDYANGRAVPIGVEGRSATVNALILTLPVVYDIPMPRIKTGAAPGSGASSLQQRLTIQGGLSFLARAPFLSSGLLPEEQIDAKAKLGPIAAYQWGGSRFLYPSAGIGYSYELADWVSFGVSASVMVPIFNLWTGESLPFIDAMHAGGGIWLSFTDFWRHLGKKK